MLEINWKVTTQEASAILNVLAEKPFKEVAQLISKLNTAATEQVTAYEKEKNGPVSTG